MKKLQFILTFFLFATTYCFSQNNYDPNNYKQNNYDIVIVGGTPGGIMSAISAAREGKTSLILERTDNIGGLPVNGLGATDIATKKATTGLFKEFVDRNYSYYANKYGKDSKQVKDCSLGYHFEPKVAALTFSDMLDKVKDKVTVLKMRQFDSEPQNVIIINDKIKSIRVLNRTNQQYENYTGKVFIDATYEGDLAAAAKVPFRVDREGRDEFNELGAGRVYKYWKGPEMDGSTFQGDNALQAFNYRLCLTNDPNIRVLPEKPANYNRNEYLSLIEDVYTGRHCGVEMMQVTSEMMQSNREHIKKGNKTQIPGDVWGMAKVSSMTALPNMKMDANNQHLALISTDLPEENWPWPTSGWGWRDQYAKRLKEYTLGLLWFAQNDKELPENFRKACREWGLAKDEYPDNEHFPRQVYVREGRRFIGQYFFTANDALPTNPGKRPPLHATSITASHYALDSHAVRKRETGKTLLDGFLSYPTAVYTVPFGVIVPSKTDNLLIPVPVSGSHIGFSTLRMEPCWMALGQAAGLAASIAIDKDLKINNIPISLLQDKLIKQKATLMYFRDIDISSPDFEMAQYMSLKGYLQEWDANLDNLLDDGTATTWMELSKTNFEYKNKTKREVLKMLYGITKND